MDDRVFELIPLDRIEPDPALPPRAIDEVKLRRLARSLQRRGQLEAITVRRVLGLDKFLIINGVRRWHAAKYTSLVRDLWCQIVDDPDEGEILLRRLTEHLAREDFPLLELAELIAKVQALRGWSFRRMASEFGVSIGRVRRPMVLLRLPRQVQEMVRRGELKPSHAFDIEKAPAGEQLAIAKRVVQEGLTHQQTVVLIGRHRSAAGDEPRIKRRRWKFHAPGDCEVVVVMPPGEGRAAVRLALLAAVLHVDRRGTVVPTGV